MPSSSSPYSSQPNSPSPRGHQPRHREVHPHTPHPHAPQPRHAPTHRSGGHHVDRHGAEGQSANTEPVRRLQTPAERFGMAPVIQLPVEPIRDEEPGSIIEASATDAPELSAELDPLQPPDPFQPLDGNKSSARSERSSRARHQRQRYSPARTQKRPAEKNHFDRKPINGHEKPASQPTRRPAPKVQVSPAVKRRAKRAFGKLALLAVAIFAVQMGVAALSAPQFQVKDVALSGLSQTPKSSVTALLSSLKGQNVFRSNRRLVAAQIEKLPTVASAQIKLQMGWPPHLALVVTERQPLYRIQCADGQWVADRSGLLYRRATAQDAKLYEIVAPNSSAAAPLKTLSNSFWPQAVELYDALQNDNMMAAQNSGSSDGTPNGNRPYWQLNQIDFDASGAANLSLRDPNAPATVPVSLSGSTANSSASTVTDHTISDPSGDRTDNDDEAGTDENETLGESASSAPAPDELLVRLGDDEWAQKLSRARQAIAYFKRTGRRAVELDLISYDRPRWRPKPEILAGNSQKTSQTG